MLKILLLVLVLIGLPSCKPRRSDLASVGSYQQESSLSPLLSLRYRHAAGDVSVSVSEDGRYFATVGKIMGDFQGRVEQLIVWDAETLRPVKRDFPLSSDDLSLTGISAMQFAPGGNGIAVCARGALYYWPIDWGRASTPTPKRYPMLQCRAFAFADDHTIIALEGTDNQIYRIDLEKDERRLVLVSKGDKYRDLVVAGESLILARGKTLEIRPTDLPEFSAETKSRVHKEQVLTIDGSDIYDDLTFDGARQIIATTRAGDAEYWELATNPRMVPWRSKNFLTRRSAGRSYRSKKYGKKVATAYGRAVQKGARTNDEFRASAYAAKESFERFNFLATDTGHIVMGLELHSTPYLATGPQSRAKLRRVKFEPLIHAETSGTVATSLAFNESVSTLVMGFSNGAVKLWRIDRVLTPHPVASDVKSVASLFVAADSQSFFIIDASGQVEQREARSGEVIDSTDLEGGVERCAVSADQSRWACQQTDQVVWGRLSAMQPEGRISLSDDAKPLAIAMNDSRIAVGSEGGQVDVYAISSGAVEQTIKMNLSSSQARISSLNLGHGMSDGYVFVTDTLGQTFWVTLSSKPQQGLLRNDAPRGKKPQVFPTALSPDGSALYLVGRKTAHDRGGSTYVDHTSFGKDTKGGEHRRLNTHKDYFHIGALAPNPSNGYVVTTGSFGQSVQFRFMPQYGAKDLATPLDRWRNFLFLKQQDPSEADEASLPHIARVAPDGSFVISAEAKGQVRIQWLTSR